MASWLNMMLGLEERTREVPRAYVPYDDLMSDWRTALRRAEQGLRTPLLAGATPQQEEDAAGLVDESLRRAQADWDALGLAPDLRDLAHRSWVTLQGLSDAEDAGARAELDGVRAEYHAMYDAAADLTRSRVRAARVEEHAARCTVRPVRRRRNGHAGAACWTADAPRARRTNVVRELSRQLSRGSSRTVEIMLWSDGITPRRRSLFRFLSTTTFHLRTCRWFEAKIQSA